jgi:hypothetical protein
MGVVIEICVKHPGGPPRIKGTDMATAMMYVYIHTYMRYS